jgi:uncharacterized protein DUF6687
VFHYVPFGSRASDDAICCDGLVPGVGLDLSHWRGNATPAELKADTSVEIALRWAAKSGERRPVVNNHFDADGVLAVWTLLEPELALRHAALITAASEAGDFEEWPADERGLWLEAAITALAADDDEASYTRVLEQLPALVADIEAHRQLYGASWEALCEAEKQAERGALEVVRLEDVAILQHRPGVVEMPGPVLSRRIPDGCVRWLLAFEQGDGRFDYRYELARWAWADTVRRPAVTSRGFEALGRGWTAAKGGMTAIARTTEPIADDPATVAAAIAAAEIRT